MGRPARVLHCSASWPAMFAESLLMDPEAIIFDCDGTLADTMPAHYEAWATILRRYQLAMSEDRFYELGGWPTKRVAELLVREAGRPLDVEQISREKESLFEEKLHEVR